MLSLDSLIQKNKQFRAIAGRFGKAPSDTEIEDFFYYLLHSKDAVFVMPYVFMRFFGMTLDQGIAAAKQFEEEVVGQDQDQELYALNRTLHERGALLDPRLQKIEKKYPELPQEPSVQGLNSDAEIQNFKFQIPNKPQIKSQTSEKEHDTNDKRQTTNDKPVANFYFSPEDEAEIAEMAKRVVALSAVRHTDFYAEFAAKAAIQALRVVSLSGDLRSRLESIIVSRLRDLRDLLETKEALMKPIDRGGLELSQADANRILKEAEKVRSAVTESLRVLQEKQRLAHPVPFHETDVGISSLVSKEAPPGNRSAFAGPSLHHAKVGGEGEKRMGFPRTPESPGLEPVVQGSRRKSSLALSAPVSSPSTAMDALAGLQKNAKEQKRLTGPVEEIETLSLEEFRKWGPPDSAAQKIKEKIDLLSLESLMKKKQGVEAWKKSAVYKQYLTLGVASLDQKKGIEDIVADLQKNKKGTLTKQEFDAIADLNRKLQFN